MKKIPTLLIAASAVLSMAACSGRTSEHSNDTAEPAANMSETDDSSSNSETGSYVTPDEEGLAQGLVGDTMRTAWFDFTVNSVLDCGSEYEGYTCAAGNKLLLLNLTIVNTYEETNPMGEGDFMLIWGSEDNDHAFPVQNASIQADSVLPDEYDMQPGDEVTGDLLFEVPASINDYGFYYFEIDNEETVHDSFVVYFASGFDRMAAVSSETITGVPGDVMSTYWFDFTVTNVSLCAEYNGSVPSEGKTFLEVDLTLKNTISSAVPMYKSDFDVEWDATDSYEIPFYVSADGTEVTENSFHLEEGSTLPVVMVFKVDEGYDTYTIYFDETFADGSTGNVYEVILSPERQ